MNYFSTELWHVTKSGLYTTTINNQLSDWTEKKLQSTSQSQTCTKKCHGHCLVVCCQSDPLHPSGSCSSHLRRTFSKLRCTKNCNACSQHWSTEWAWFFSTTKPDHKSHNQHFKNWMNWAMKLCLTWLLPTDSHFFKHLDNSLQGKCFHNQQEAKKCFPSVCQILKHGFLTYMNKPTYFSLTKMCWM